MAPQTSTQRGELTPSLHFMSNREVQEALMGFVSTRSPVGDIVAFEEIPQNTRFGFAVTKHGLHPVLAQSLCLRQAPGRCGEVLHGRKREVHRCFGLADVSAFGSRVR